MLESIEISVVIPVFNGERYLKQTVNSVLSQPYKNIEVICIDDGSTDLSNDILQGLTHQDHRVRIFTQENHGVAFSRNRGIEEARGRWINFLDQDDVWVKEAVTDAIIRRINDKEYDIASFALYCSNQDITRVNMEPRKDEIVINPAERMYEHYRHHSSYLFKRSFLQKYQLKVDQYRDEDTRFKAQCILLARKIIYLSQPLFIYRNNNQSVTHNSKDGVKVLCSVLDGYQFVMENSPYASVRDFCKNTMPRFFMELLYFAAGKCSSQEIDALLEKYQMQDLIDSGAYINESNKRKWEQFNNNRALFLVKTYFSRQSRMLLIWTIKKFLPRKVIDKYKYPMSYEKCGEKK